MPGINRLENFYHRNKLRLHKKESLRDIRSTGKWTICETREAGDMPTMKTIYQIGKQNLIFYESETRKKICNQNKHAS